MTSMRRHATVLLAAAALSLPLVASAEQPADQLCDGDKAADPNQPHANRDKPTSDKTDPKVDPKARPKQDDKAGGNRPDTTS